tara:strand:+ start:25 stop:387 length:363 start_codon:yes stop_codon:yes gene_type:complete
MTKKDVWSLDDNEKVHGLLVTSSIKPHIIEGIEARLEVGMKQYGHGIGVHDNTMNYDTTQDSWAEMGLEEVLDAIIYVAAQYVRDEELKADNLQLLRLGGALTGLAFVADLLISHMEQDS